MVLFIFIFSFFLAVLPLSPALALDIMASSAILMDIQSGQVLYALNSHTLSAPASTTKVMTAILALELGQLSQKVVASKEAAHTGGSSIYLEEGEVLTLEELLYGLLLNSGNDAAVAIAEHIGGSVQDFAFMMNMKAVSLGAMHTTFQNPHGLPQEGHLTTAYDLALITSYALENPLFSHMVSLERHDIPWKDREWNRHLQNSNLLLSKYPYADGVKTGWTRAAGPCLISSASRGGRRLIAVVLNSQDMYRDSVSLLEYGFLEFRTIPLIKKDETFGVQSPFYRREKATLVTSSHLFYSLPVQDSYRITREIIWKENLRLPLIKEQPVAWLEASVEGEVIGRIPLLLQEELRSPPFWYRIWEHLKALLFSPAMV